MPSLTLIRDMQIWGQIQSKTFDMIRRAQNKA